MNNNKSKINIFGYHVIAMNIQQSYRVGAYHTLIINTCSMMILQTFAFSRNTRVNIIYFENVEYPGSLQNTDHAPFIRVLT